MRKCRVDEDNTKHFYIDREVLADNSHSYQN